MANSIKFYIDKKTETEISKYVLYTGLTFNEASSEILYPEIISVLNRELSLQEAAQVLNINSSYLMSLIRDDILKCHKGKETYYISNSDLVDFKDRQDKANKDVSAILDKSKIIQAEPLTEDEMNELDQL